MSHPVVGAALPCSPPCPSPLLLTDVIRACLWHTLYFLSRIYPPLSFLLSIPRGLLHPPPGLLHLCFIARSEPWVVGPPPLAQSYVPLLPEDDYPRGSRSSISHDAADSMKMEQREQRPGLRWMSAVVYDKVSKGVEGGAVIYSCA